MSDKITFGTVLDNCAIIAFTARYLRINSDKEKLAESLVVISTMITAIEQILALEDLELTRTMFEFALDDLTHELTMTELAIRRAS